MVPAYPLLASAGAYAPNAVYTPAQIKEIIQHAYVHGIRVVFELDMPGHAASWSKGYPDVCAKCPQYESEVNNIPLNPAVQQTFDLVAAVIKHTSSLMMDQFIHFGGDELETGCWKEDKVGDYYCYCKPIRLRNSHMYHQRIRHIEHCSIHAKDGFHIF